MALYEIQVVQRNGAIENRYSDRAVRVGEELKVGAHRVLVVGQVATPNSPLADSAFLCSRLTDGSASVPAAKARPAWRRAA